MSPPSTIYPESSASNPRRRRRQPPVITRGFQQPAQQAASSVYSHDADSDYYQPHLQPAPPSSSSDASRRFREELERRDKESEVTLWPDADGRAVFGRAHEVDEEGIEEEDEESSSRTESQQITWPNLSQPQEGREGAEEWNSKSESLHTAWRDIPQPQHRSGSSQSETIAIHLDPSLRRRSFASERALTPFRQFLGDQEVLASPPKKRVDPDKDDGARASHRSKKSHRPRSKTERLARSFVRYFSGVSYMERAQEGKGRKSEGKKS